MGPQLSGGSNLPRKVSSDCVDQNLSKSYSSELGLGHVGGGVKFYKENFKLSTKTQMLLYMDLPKCTHFELLLIL